MTSFGSEEKSIIYRLDIIFSLTRVAQLMVSKIKFFCQMDIRRYPQTNTKLHTMSGSWKMGHLVKILGEIAVYPYGNVSNFKLEGVRYF